MKLKFKPTAKNLTESFNGPAFSSFGMSCTIPGTEKYVVGRIDVSVGFPHQADEESARTALNVAQRIAIDALDDGLAEVSKLIRNDD